MSNTQNSTTQQNKFSLLSHEEADELLAKVQQQIAEQTFDTDNKELIQQMIECMGDTRGMVRLYYAEALGKVGKPAIDLLIDALLHHSNVVVRRAAGKTITLIEDPKAIPHLIHALLHDEDTVVQSSAIGALARMGQPAVEPLLEILASSTSTESHKGHCAWALAFIGAKAEKQLYAAYHSDSPEVRSAVVGAIAKVAEENRQEKALNLLVESLNDPAENVRSEAAAVLGNLKYQSAVPKLIELLEHSVGETRKSSALSLMKIGDLNAIAPLKKALSKESEERIKKAISLAISLLEKQSEDDDWD